MTITPSNKIKMTRIKGMPELVDNIGKYIINENNEIKYVDESYFSSFLNSTDIVKGFKIESFNDSDLTYSSCSLISPKINNKQYILKLEGGSVDTNKSFSENGSADEIITKLWSQPILTSNDSPYMKVSAQDELSVYEAWKAFTGTNSNENDCWVSTETELPKWLQIDLTYPLIIEKIALQNRNIDDSDTHSNMRAFTIHGLNMNDEWELLVDVDGINNIPNMNNNAWNEYELENNDTLYKSIKYECTSSVTNKSVSIGRFEIIGRYKGYRLPNTYYNIFVIGKENIENPEPRIITTNNEYPSLPEGYTYAVKLGFYKVNMNDKTEFFYPQKDLIDSYNNNFILMSDISEDGSSGYIVYTSGWKIQWGNNENPMFPIAFTNIPVIVSRGATDVTKTGMTIPAQKWAAEGY